MGRPKKFTRDAVLTSAIPVFWEHGYADTCLHDLEEATGVNKSGLYAEFKSKEGLFLASLEHYLERRSGKAILSAKPLGWKNIDTLLKIVLTCPGGQKGCFAINSMREFAILPPAALKLVAKSNARLKRLLERNIRAEKTHMDAAAVTAIVATFLSGLCLEQNLNLGKSSSARKVDAFMKILRAL